METAITAPDSEFPESKDRVAEPDQEHPLDVGDGVENGMARFCERAFVDPTSARAGSEALIAAFDDNGLWLASLLQPSHLVAELRQSCSTLTDLIVTQWARQGETHKLCRLGDALVESSPPVTSQEGGRILAQLAGLLGILRPLRAQHLLDAARSLLTAPADAPLIQEASEWVETGRILQGLPPDDLQFWNRSLREASAEMDWDTTETRAALRRLAPLVPRDGTDPGRFHYTLPGCLWDLLRHPAPPTATVPPVPQAPISARNGGGFALGVLTGLVCASIVAICLWFLQPWGKAISFVAEIPATVPAKPQSAAAPTPVPVVSMPRPVANPSVVEVEPPPSRFIHSVIDPQEAKRRALVEDIVRQHPNVQRLHSLAKAGSLRENEGLIQGRSTLAQYGTPDHQALIRLLVLDPPKEKEARLSALKLILRLLPPRETISLLEICLSAGSPNQVEARQCANLFLDLGTDSLSTELRAKLQDLAIATER